MSLTLLELLDPLGFVLAASIRERGRPGAAAAAASVAAAGLQVAMDDGTSGGVCSVKIKTKILKSIFEN